MFTQHVGQDFKGISGRLSWEKKNPGVCGLGPVENGMCIEIPDQIQAVQTFRLQTQRGQAEGKQGLQNLWESTTKKEDLIHLSGWKVLC